MLLFWKIVLAVFSLGGIWAIWNMWAMTAMIGWPIVLIIITGIMTVCLAVFLFAVWSDVLKS